MSIYQKCEIIYSNHKLLEYGDTMEQEAFVVNILLLCSD